ncbi:aryl-alcohol dehydrogenase-like predicted oxidoreductase [Herbaspirillum sp. Sphag1AN]|uniref:aldo/keto reductase n=1 Tax=unclassified Herbaspirillum TaxID=2624150 RepID=UPI00161D06B5|nr:MULTISPECIES: aldo/keto reductase [unclassified Herbaspirillum]MBB3213713.1 aryl-alcohol dehydrogenase-like predicted oxidoreductase [Herbaspirillum sp. Sphag1AN]MBB3246910.1 aryl-alcohol dehydrogenase-like predicted oxidoreductase [Herbaspirillum sp. Sphag64]
MHYRRLGKSNLTVSALCLGTMMFGDQTDSKEAASIVASAREHGVNFIDTADVYSKGKSEEMVGTLLQGQRHEWVLASKLGNPMSETPNQSHYSRHWLVRETDNILRRLKTDYLDILYLHRDYHEENLEETVLALGDLIRSGKILGFGVSNFRAWRIAEIVRLCQQHHVPLPLVCQPYYNLLNRMPEVEILPACLHYGLGVVPYSPIARGVLTGKYKPGQQPGADTRAGRGDKRILETEFREESLIVAERLQQHVITRDIKLGQFATAWVLANQAVSSVIAGPRTLAQMEDYYAAVSLTISAEEEALVDSLVTPGHASTPGYHDPNYPFFGRPVAR